MTVLRSTGIVLIGAAVIIGSVYTIGLLTSKDSRHAQKKFKYWNGLRTYSEFEARVQFTEEAPVEVKGSHVVDYGLTNILLLKSDDETTLALSVPKGMRLVFPESRFQTRTYLDNNSIAILRITDSSSTVHAIIQTVPD